VPVGLAGYGWLRAALVIDRDRACDRPAFAKVRPVRALSSDAGAAVAGRATSRRSAQQLAV